MNSPDRTGVPGSQRQLWALLNVVAILGSFLTPWTFPYGGPMFGVQVVSFAIFVVASGSLVTFTHGIDVLGGPEALGITLADIRWGLFVLAGSSGAAAYSFAVLVADVTSVRTRLVPRVGASAVVATVARQVLKACDSRVLVALLLATAVVGYAGYGVWALRIGVGLSWGFWLLGVGLGSSIGREVERFER